MANSEDDGRKDSFIRERIVGKRRSRKEQLLHLAARLGVTVILAAVFGAVAGAVFAKVSYNISGKDMDDLEEEAVSIPRDEDSSYDEVSGETTETSAENTAEETTQEHLEDVVQSVINDVDINLDLDDYSKLYLELSSMVSEVNKSVVTVLSKEERVDWFDNNVENGAVCSGIVWSITDREVLIAAICDFSENTSSIEIQFYDDTYADAYIKGYDLATKLTVIAVPLENVSSKTSLLIDTVKLGNSYIVSEGEPVIIVGNPVGYIGSLLYGNISYMIDNMLIADMSQKGMVIDAATYKGSNGFVINYSGELLGIYGADYSGDFTRAYGISDLKGILEKLSNGSSIAYLGIIGRGITDSVAQQYGLVKGIFITDTVVNEAAYMAGIRNGDIITAVDGDNVFTLHSLQNILESHSAGDVVKVTVMRNGAEEYTEIVFNIELGSR